MRVPKSSRLLVLLLCATVAFAIYSATSGINPSFASEGDTASQEDEAPTLESLTERIAGLENRIAELELHQDEMAAQELAYPIFDTIAAVYLLDQVDVHALYDRLHEGEGILPGDAGPYRRLVHLLSAVDLPPELEEEGTALIEILSQLSAALADDDLESAVPLALDAHEAQHDFSRNVADWFDRTLIPVEEDPDQADQSDDCITEDSDEDGDSHGHSETSDEDSNGHSDDSDSPCDDDDSNDTHDDGHSHGE